MMRAVHRGIDGRRRERGPRHQLVPRAELPLGRYIVGLREAGTPSGIRLGYRDEADLVGVVECVASVASVGVEATSTGADHDELERLAHRPARRTSTATIAMKISPINSVSSVT